MENYLANRKYEVHISSLKGIACVGVMLGHFLGIVKYATDFPIDFKLLEILEKFRLSFLVNESFWLYLFFIISGYLCAKTKISSFYKLATKSVLRFFRLAIPIFLGNIIIFVIAKTLDFHNMDTTLFFDNIWLQNSYNIELSFNMLLTSPIDTLFLKQCYFNSPYWVLSEMLLGSIIVYAFTYLKTKIPNKVIVSIIYIFLLSLSLIFSRIVFSTLIGIGLVLYSDLIEKIVNKPLAILFLLGSTGLVIIYPHWSTSLPMFCTWIVFLPKIKYLYRIFKFKFLDFIGKISFGIYALHWPIFCSVGMIIFLCLIDSVGIGKSTVIAIISSIAITLISAIIYYFTFEKISNIIVKGISKIIDKNYETISAQIKKQ